MKPVKKALILGASHAQLPFIKKAVQEGYYLIVCSFTPNDPGIEFADEYCNISTTDRESVLALAKEKKIDVVLSHGSDSGALTAAFVAEKLNLPGNPYRTVGMMTDKYLFRSFLKANGFNVPRFCSFTEAEFEGELETGLDFPVIVKPVDSSGGRGITRVKSADELARAALLAFSYSASKTIIVEEVIETDHSQVHGNGFVADGELLFSHLGDHQFSGLSNNIPVATTWPSRQPGHHISRIESEVNRFIKVSGFRFGPVNIEARIDSSGDIFLIEVAPRSGVHFLTDLTFKGTGVDLTQQTFNYLNGVKIDVQKRKSLYVAYYLIHSLAEGVFLEIEIQPALKKHILDMKLYISIGDKITTYRDMNNSVGVIHFTFDNAEEMLNVIKSAGHQLNVVVG